MVSFLDLLDVPSLVDLRVIAGKQGLTREIRAVSVMDSPDSYKWLKGGEFIVTSAFLYANDPKMLEYVFENITSASCAGFGIKKDRFLSEIPEAIIQRANKMRFPIIEIPYSFGWSDIFYEFYKLYLKNTESNDAEAQAPHVITDAERNDNKIYEELLSSLIKGNVSNRLYAAVSALYDKTSAYACVMIISANDTKDVYKTLLNNAENHRLSKLGAYKSYIHHNETEGEAVAVFEYIPADDKTPPHEWLYLLFEDMEQYGFDGRISAGRLYSNCHDIETSYEEARDAMLIGRSACADRHCYLYYSLSYICTVYRNTPELIDLSLIERFAASGDTLKFEAFDTLEAFIKYGGSAKTAEALHIHENTLRYRIQRINDFFHFNITDALNAQMLAIQIAFWKLKRDKP